MKQYFQFSFLLLCCLAKLCSCSNPKNQEARVIDVEAAVGTGSIKNTSEFIKELTYIPLETNQSSLIKHVQKIIIQNDKIYIYDKAPSDLSGKVMIFGINGRHIATLDKRGRGPDEYFSTQTVAVTPSDHILIMTRDAGILEYDQNLKLVKKLIFNDGGKRWLYDNVVVLKEGLYALTIYRVDYNEPDDGAYTFAIYDDLLENCSFEIKQPIKIFTRDSRPAFSWGGTYFPYLLNDEMIFYRIHNDSIFGIDLKNNYAKSLRYTFNFGKYALPEPPKDNPLKTYEEESRFISFSSILESDNYMFIKFVFRGMAPEPFGTPSRSVTLMDRVVTSEGWQNTMVYGIYDKNQEKLSLLNQPTPGILGLKNDLDGGPPIIWPESVMSGNKLITYYTAMEMMELIEQGKVDKELFGNITDNDNPIVVIAKEK